MKFSHKPKGGTIGSGSYIFRHYGNGGSITPQLNAPQNFSLSGSVVSWDKVDNAEKYEIFADNSSVGEVKE